MNIKLKIIGRFVKYIVCIFVIVSQDCAIAGGIDHLVKYASPDGSMSNVNKPAIVKDQSGGYMTGGSIILRGPKPMELTPLNIQTPKFSYDACTGSADFRFGAMTYISASEFSSFLKNVARSSGAYLVQMSIKSACPQCQDIMTYLETVARDINGMSMDQCSMAQSIAEGAFSKLTAGSRQQCMMKGNKSKSKKDLFEASSECQDNADASDKTEDEEFESLLGDQFNLVWKALNQKAGVGSGSAAAAASSGSEVRGDERGIRELMMSISGTIIGKKEDGKYKFYSKPTLLRDKDLIEKYIGNNTGDSKVDLYKCDETKQCLYPEITKATLTESETLNGNVSRILRSLVAKVKKDEGVFTEEEEALISFSTIPILQIIQTEIATKGNTDHVVVRIQEYIDIICYDFITNFMDIMLSRVISKVQALEHAQVDNTVIRDFITDAENIRRYLSDTRLTAFRKLQIITEVKVRLESQVKAFEHNFNYMMKNF
jgi:conjugative transfer pilus assembly protein TraH